MKRKKDLLESLVKKAELSSAFLRSSPCANKENLVCFDA